MGIFFKRNDILSTSEKRAELIVIIESKFKRICDNLQFSIEFLEDSIDIEGVDGLIDEIKEEYLTDLEQLGNEIDYYITELRSRVDNVNKNDKWMNSKKLVDSMQDMNAVIGKLIAIKKDVEEAKKVVNVSEEKNKGNEGDAPAGPQ